jgi:hypothetical protein
VREESDEAVSTMASNMAVTDKLKVEEKYHDPDDPDYDPRRSMFHSYHRGKFSFTNTTSTITTNMSPRELTVIEANQAAELEDVKDILWYNDTECGFQTLDLEHNPDNQELTGEAEKDEENENEGDGDDEDSNGEDYDCQEDFVGQGSNEDEEGASNCSLSISPTSPEALKQ